MSLTFKLKNIFPILVNIKFPIKVIRVSSSLPQFFSYLVPKTKSKFSLLILLIILFNSRGLNEPSALNIQKYFVLTDLIPSIKASPYPLFL